MEPSVDIITPFAVAEPEIGVGYATSALAHHEMDSLTEKAIAKFKPAEASAVKKGGRGIS